MNGRIKQTLKRHLLYTDGTFRVVFQHNDQKRKETTQNNPPPTKNIFFSLQNNKTYSLLINHICCYTKYCCGIKYLWPAFPLVILDESSIIQSGGGSVERGWGSLAVGFGELHSQLTQILWNTQRFDAHTRGLGLEERWSTDGAWGHILGHCRLMRMWCDA